MDDQILTILLGTVLPAIIGLMGGKWQQAKGQMKDGLHQMDMVKLKVNQSVTLAHTIAEALEDDKITTEEAKRIGKQVRAILGGLNEVGNYDKTKGY